MFSLGKNEAYQAKNKSETNTGKEIADVAIGAGLMIAGPEVAKSVYEQTSGAMGTNLNFLPQNKAIETALNSGLSTIQGLVGPCAAAALLYIGGKKLLSAFSEK